MIVLNVLKHYSGRHQTEVLQDPVDLRQCVSFPFVILSTHHVVYFSRIKKGEGQERKKSRILFIYYESIKRRVFHRGPIRFWVSVAVCPLYGLLGHFPIPSTTDDGWGGWSTHTIHYGWRMGGLPEPIRVRHPSTDRTTVNFNVYCCLLWIVFSLLIDYCCLLWIVKARAKDKTYKRMSVRWKTTN